MGKATKRAAKRKAYRSASHAGTRGLMLAMMLALEIGAPSAASRVRAQGAGESGGGRVADLSRRAQQEPGNVDTQLTYGRALIRAGQLGRAEKQLQRAVKLSKSSARALFEVARVRFAEGDYRRSRTACKSIRRAHRGHILYEVCMARAFLVWRRASRADEHIQAAFKLDPNHLEALFALAEAQRIRGELEAGEQTYHRVLSLDPSYAEANTGLAQLYLVHNQKRKAEAILRKGIERHPDHPDMMYLLGTLAPAAEGVRLLEGALARRPGWNDAEAALGAALNATGQHKQAEQRLRSVLKRDPNNGLAYGGLGASLFAQGKLQHAETTLLKALQVQPNHPDAALSLARLFARTGRDEDAFEYFRKSAGMRATDSGPLVEAAQLAREKGRSVLAAAFVERALERHPNQPLALAMRGDLLAARGDRAGAIASYKQALASTAGGGRRGVDRAAIEKKLRALE
ncbi:MAG: tetratricopeptide repeat protein [Myxococcales bacterium]|nr:tetratricopeptide repeat protein [Myxococcales bacterium]MDD9972101.1 tetratricopeptide repeat protein [Myxococcales bacterium]